MTITSDVETYLDHLFLRVILFQEVNVVVNQGKSTASATSELCLETVDCDALLFGLELFSKLLLELSLGNTAQLGMNDLNVLKSGLNGKYGELQAVQRVKSRNLILTHCFLPRSGFFMNLRT